MVCVLVLCAVFYYLCVVELVIPFSLFLSALFVSTTENNTETVVGFCLSTTTRDLHHVSHSISSDLTAIPIQCEEEQKDEQRKVSSCS
jgi:hypothetical protein